MNGKTLREIMLSVLKENGESMNPKDLAKEIREKGLYTQKDGTPLKDRHVRAMVYNCPNSFIKIDKNVAINDGTMVVEKIKKQSSQPHTKAEKPILKFNNIEDFNSNPMEDWFHESKLCATLANYFIVNGFEIKKDTSRNKSEKGIDLIVSKDWVSEFIEVKGYPSIYYVEKKKRGLEKKTKPYLQSTHWFSGCLSSTLKNYESKETKLAMAFPACSRYEELVIKNQKYFTDNDLDVKVYFIDEEGGITISNLNKNLIIAE